MAGRKKTDPVSEAVMDVVALEQQREEQAKQAQVDREQRIAECHQFIGRIQAVNMVEKLATVSTLMWLKDVKESKLYADLPGIETWDKFCESLGKSRRLIDEQLLNLQAFGADFLETVSSLRVGYREMKKLRQLSHDGAITIDAEYMVIGEERIPLTPDHKDDLQAAIESLIEQQAAMTAEVEAQKKAFDRVQADTRKTMTKLQKDLDKFTAEAEAKGLTPEEDAFVQKCENARITIDGFLNQFDPSINPLPDDATPRMKAALMHTLKNTGDALKKLNWHIFLLNYLRAPPTPFKLRFYGIWIDRFIAFRGGDEGLPINGKDLEAFSRPLADSCQDWQIRQAGDAVRLYLFFLQQEEDRTKITDKATTDVGVLEEKMRRVIGD